MRQSQTHQAWEISCSRVMTSAAAMMSAEADAKGNENRRGWGVYDFGMGKRDEDDALASYGAK